MNGTPIIYVVGSSRSGTTMLSRILGQHPEVHTLHETHFVGEICPAAALHQPVPKATLTGMAARLLARQRAVEARYVGDGQAAQRYRPAAKQLLAPLPDPLTPHQLFHAHVDQEARQRGKSVVVEQTPRHLFFLSQLLPPDPGARAVIMVRDARDVILSQKYKWRAIRQQSSAMAPAARRFWANYHPITMSLLWNRAAAALASVRQWPQVRVIKFESFLTRPEAVLRALCDFLSLPFQPEMLHVAAADNSSFPDLSATAATGINQQAAFRWRQASASRYDLAICQHICRHQLQQLGYEISARLQPTVLDRGRAWLSWPFKLLIALLLNPQRGHLLRQQLRRK